MFEQIYKNLTLNPAKLIEYGFREEENKYKLDIPIMAGEFMLHLTINSKGNISHSVIDTSTNEPYIIYMLPDTAGEYVGKVRQAISDQIEDIVAKCYYKNVFKQKQTLDLINYVSSTYNAELEFLWEDTEGAIWRNKDNNKWFGLVMRINLNKLGKTSRMGEILNLRVDPDTLQKLIDNQKYFAGYHMNKKHWLTIILNGSVSMTEIKDRIENSYQISKTKK